MADGSDGEVDWTDRNAGESISQRETDSASTSFSAPTSFSASTSFSAASPAPEPPVVSQAMERVNRSAHDGEELQPGMRDFLMTEFGFWLIMLGGVYAFALLADVLVPGLFWRNYLFRGTLTEVLAFGAAGGLIAQIAVLSVFCALGPTSLQWRFLVTSLMAIGVTCAYIVGLQLPDFPDSGMPAMVGIFILAIGFGGFVFAAVAVKGISLLTGERLVVDGLLASNSNRTQSFSIGYLIAWTTAIAFAIAAIRSLMPTQDTGGPPPGQMTLIIVLAVQHCVYTILLLYGCMMLTLRPRKNLYGLLAIGLLLALAAPTNLLLMSQYRGMRIRGEFIASLYAYSFGFIITTVGFLVLLRVAGYRLVKSEPSELPA